MTSDEIHWNWMRMNDIEWIRIEFNEIRYRDGIEWNWTEITEVY